MNARDGFERENRGYRDEPATIPCGLLAKLQLKGEHRAPCRDLFYSELGRDLHHQEEHYVGLALVEAPRIGLDSCEPRGTTTGGGRRQASPPPVASTRRQRVMWWEREPGERKVSERMRARR